MGRSRTRGFLFAVNIIGPFFNDLSRGPAAPVMPARLGGTGLFLLVLTCIAVLSFPSRFSRGFLLWPLGMIPPEMVALPCRVSGL